ncbi:NAD-dependent epimerase/dehydratase, partial [Pisolithus croceorrhizus]
AIKHVIENKPQGSCFRKCPGEQDSVTFYSPPHSRDPKQMLELFEKYQPTHVIHLAVLVSGLFANREHKVSILSDNMLINDNVLNMACSKKMQKVISCLSTCIFLDKINYPLTEEKVHLGPPHDSNFGYTYVKCMVNMQNHMYKEEFSCNFTSAILTNIFRPHDNFDLKHVHVIPALIHKCYLAKKNGTPFKVMGDRSP